MRHVLMAAGLLAAPICAHAQCAERLAALEAKTDSIADPHVKDVFAHDMRHAHKELGENDERDCKRILDHAEQLLAGQ